ncbi:ferredoxin reductase family protein [Alkalimarinus alittae]|uniref:Ferric reductase-like transmembrane domain-containing protein n=1 Tax=Alkalimarinus alittae TaxID=2961619 RepID=A0ABY6N213_9ALTE|nr:ferric reductase-like transmembrane domain-containing protein [Alkalimarinus alittae]UZE96148.1 ferric reductase-like transmembrane domain-containing protein [Alkalimarinus alittae]
MKPEKTTIALALIIIGIIIVWGTSYVMSNTANASLPWEIYDNSLYLSGLLSISLMSVTMILATRPALLERPFNGLDQVYRLHKWTGIFAVIFAALHWLIEMGDDVIKAIFGRGGRLHHQDFSGFVDMMRDAAEAVGEWGIYLVFAMLVLTLWKRFPYNIWRYLHRALPILYLLLVFHSAWLAPLDWWQQPLGLLMALLLTGGSIASIQSLSGKVGRSRQVQGTIQSISTLAMGITEVTCQLDTKWKGHRAGQFALVTFDRIEGAHPFTIASADQGNRQVTFQIKALGDYTNHLGDKLKTGQPVTIEGPYGKFNFKRHKPKAKQIWIAGGIGVTPFLAWLESLQDQPELTPVAQLHYCTSNSTTDPFVKRLQEACSGLADITLHVHDSNQGEKLTSDQLLTQHKQTDTMEVWFCGPSGWAKVLEKELRQRLKGSLFFRKEAFELR